MKIIQLNIWQGKLGEQIIAFLRAEKPDFVCMQEVNDLKGRSGYKFFATLEEIKTGAGFSETVMSPTLSSRYMERELDYGNATLSQWPIVATATVFTRGVYKRRFDVETGDGNVRNLQIVTVDIKGKKLHILNHHGHHVPDTKAGNSETLRQMMLIAAEIDKIDGPLILCGDFNLTPDTKSISVLNKKLTNLSLVHKLQETGTVLSNIHATVDYIFVNDLVKVRHFKMSDEVVSDHKALILEFDL